jgi:MFS family permease
MKLQVYYGWWVVAMAMAIYAIVAGATAGAFGVFVVPVSAELHLTRAEMNTALIFQHIGNAALAPLIGRMLDCVPSRPVMIVSALVFALSFVLLGLSHHLWLSAAVIAVGIPIAYLGAGSLTNTVLIARWFKARRGRAMLLAGTGMSLGAMIAPPLVALLVASQGWRPALMIMGVALGAVLLAFGFLVRERPGPADVEIADAAATPAADPEGPPIRIGALLRTTDFWLMGIGGAIAMSVSQGLTVSFIPLGHDVGMSSLQAASLLSVLGAGAVAGGLAFSIVADRLDRVHLLAGLFLAEGLVNAALFNDKSYLTLLVCAGAQGVLIGTTVHAFYALLADRFGAVSFGTVRGATFFLFGVFGMVFVRFAGEVYDRTHSYDLMFAAFLAAQVGAAILMLATRLKRRREAAAIGPARP